MLFFSRSSLLSYEWELSSSPESHAPSIACSLPSTVPSFINRSSQINPWSVLKSTICPTEEQFELLCIPEPAVHHNRLLAETKTKTWWSYKPSETVTWEHSLSHLLYSPDSHYYQLNQSGLLQGSWMQMTSDLKLVIQLLSL